MATPASRSAHDLKRVVTAIAMGGGLLTWSAVPGSPHDVDPGRAAEHRVHAADSRAAKQTSDRRGSLLEAAPAFTATVYLPSVTLRAAAPGRLRQLTSGPRRDWQPSVAPDGRQLVYVSEDPVTRRSELRLSTLDGGGDHAVAVPDLAMAEIPNFIDDGQALLFAGRLQPPGEALGDWEVYRVGLDGRGLENITQRPASEERRPTPWQVGEVCYDTNRDGEGHIYCIQPATRKEWALAGDVGHEVHPVMAPSSWGLTIPDLVFRSQRNGNSDIFRWRWSQEFPHAIQLTDDPAFESFASIAPDGHRLLFQSDRGGPNGVFLNGVFLQDDLALPARRLTDGNAEYISPRFTPDGRGVVMAGDAGGDFDIYVMDQIP